jgi:hypothetical protein
VVIADDKNPWAKPEAQQISRDKAIEAAVAATLLAINL